MKKKDKGFKQGKKPKITPRRLWRGKRSAPVWVRETAHLSPQAQREYLIKYAEALRAEAWGPSAEEKYEQYHGRW